MEKLTGLKDAPFWFLSAAAVITLSLWQIAGLRALVPADYQKFLPLAALVLGVLAVAQGVNRIATMRSARFATRREQQRQQLQKVYRPMLALFTSRHVTTSSVILAPNFSRRAKEAWSVWNERRHWRSKFKGAWRALGDAQETSSAEMEFGGSFPLNEIISIAEANAEHVDGTLLAFIRRADRSRYEDNPVDGMLTDAEYALLDHLATEEARLSKATAR